MSVLKDLRDLQWRHYSFGVLTGVAFISPGFLAVLQFRPDLMSQLDVVKVLVLSASISAPIVGFNFFAFLLAFADSSMEPVEMWMQSLLLTTVGLYVVLTVTHFASLDFRQFSLGVLAFEVLHACAFGWVGLMRTRSGRAPKTDAS